MRIPAHPLAQELLQSLPFPLAAPSANPFGYISPTRAEHVAKSLDGRIPLIVDAGPTAVGLESTIVAVDGGALRLLRPGPVDLGLALSSDGSIEAPGQLASHYAPSKPLRLNAVSIQPDEWLIGFGDIACDANLSPAADLTEAAARLFDLLHQADASDRPRIAITPIPSGGLGDAINDRLQRAAA
jgi:L-threonylcarbamoyladenylate synthase